MGKRISQFGAVIGAATTVPVLAVPTAHADDGWVAVASSPSHEQLDFAYGPDIAGAEVNALAQCSRAQRANDCRILASSPDCVAVAWDGAQPLNRAYGASGGGPDVVGGAAIAAAGPYANDLSVRCTWWPRESIQGSEKRGNFT